MQHNKQTHTIIWRGESSLKLNSYSKPKHSNQLNIAQSMLGESKFKSRSVLLSQPIVFKIVIILMLKYEKHKLSSCSLLKTLAECYFR